MKQEDKHPLVLTKKIVSSVNNNTFESFIIIGGRDIGKSTYALKSIHYAFVLLGYDDEDAWYMALDCLKFSIPEVTKYLREGIKQYKKTHTKKFVLVWDDLRKYASGVQFFLNKKLYNEIIGLLDTIKIPINTFIGTCPSMTGVMGVLRNYDTYQINVQYSTKGGAYRLAKGYLWRTSPMGQRTLYPKFHDTFYCRLPNWVWELYEKERIKITEQSISRVEKASIDE